MSEVSVLNIAIDVYCRVRKAIQRSNPKYKVLPSDPPQLMWAEGALDRANLNKGFARNPMLPKVFFFFCAKMPPLIIDHLLDW